MNTDELLTSPVVYDIAVFITAKTILDFALFTARYFFNRLFPHRSFSTLLVFGRLLSRIEFSICCCLLCCRFDTET